MGKGAFRILCVRRSGRSQRDSLTVLRRNNRSTGAGFSVDCSCVSLSSASAEQIPSVLVALEVQPHLAVLGVPG